MEALRPTLKACGQGHLAEGWEALSPEQQASLLAELQAIDFPGLTHIFKASMGHSAAPAQVAEPVRDVTTLKASSAEDRTRWRALGLEMIAAGRLGALLLAGGQGTRLGSSAPKGCYNIGLPSKKSLFQLQAERIARLQALAAEHVAGPGAPVTHPLRWYIMTSPATDAETRRHFGDHAFFGLRPAQVSFFVQGALPAMTEEGRVIMATPSSLALSPDGNGGVYTALRREGVLADMAAHGVEALDCFSVDNALVRPADPVFAGFCLERGTECGARVVAKAYPEEKVGVFALLGGKLEVVEYSELDPAQASAADPSTGELLYGWSNVCLHYFQRSWLEGVADRLAAEGRYHIARKAIPSLAGPVAGVKLELFIFDTFPWAARTALLEVAREEEFAPVKNAAGAATDSPDTARQAILSLHKKWVEAAGGRVESPAGAEVSPLVSYAGEGLAGLCSGRSFRDYDPHLQGMLSPVMQGVMGHRQYHSPRPQAFAKSRTSKGTISVTAMGGVA